MSFAHWPSESVIHLTSVQVDVDINVKHCSVTLPPGVPRVFTHNGWPWPADPHGAIARRVYCVPIEDDVRILSPNDETPVKPGDEWDRIKGQHALPSFQAPFGNN